MEYVSSIELGKTLAISDPCYEDNCHGLNGKLEILPGLYNCFVTIGEEGWYKNRIKMATIVHEDYVDLLDDVEMEVVEEFCLGVDSGLMGFFDYEYFLKHHKDKLDEEWYEKCIQSSEKAFIFSDENHKDECFISSTGLGDGKYNCLVSRNKNGKIVEVTAYFVYDFLDKKE
jgi:hypothetical protein